MRHRSHVRAFRERASLRMAFDCKPSSLLSKFPSATILIRDSRSVEMICSSLSFAESIGGYFFWQLLPVTSSVLWAAWVRFLF